MKSVTQFIEQFWLRRDPTPDTEENEFREEHYRRIQYANEHFAAGIPGWRTDRGRIYIVWGAPDEIESHPSGGQYQRDQSEGGGSTSTYPFERWRYRYLEGIGNEVIIEFVDTCMCNDYHISTDPNEKDALLHTPGGGATLNEQMGTGNRCRPHDGRSRRHRRHERRQSSLTPSSAMPSSPRLRPSSSRIWKRRSTPRSATTSCPSTCARTL